MKEPMRLCEGEQLPPALRAAFRALDQDAPSAETALRVQRALQALPAVAPAAAAAGAFSVTKLVLVSTIVVGVVTSLVVVQQRFASAPVQPQAASRAVPVAAEETVAVIDQRSRPGPRPSPRPRGLDSLGLDTSGLSETVGSVVTPAASAAVPEVVGGRVSERTETTERDGVARARPRGVARPASVRGGGVVRAALPAGHAAKAAERSTLAQAQQPETDEPAESQPLPAAPPSASATQTGEALLLAQAKRLAASDPAEALRKVDALALQHPYGTFVQERELLAIQLHRRLGHVAVAAELVRRFHERFPNSVYRRALDP